MFTDYKQRKLQELSQEDVYAAVSVRLWIDSNDYKFSLKDHDAYNSTKIVIDDPFYGIHTSREVVAQALQIWLFEDKSLKRRIHKLDKLIEFFSVCAELAESDNARNIANHNREYYEANGAADITAEAIRVYKNFWTKEEYAWQGLIYRDKASFQEEDLSAESVLHETYVDVEQIVPEANTIPHFNMAKKDNLTMQLKEKINYIVEHYTARTWCLEDGRPFAPFYSESGRAGRILPRMVTEEIKELFEGIDQKEARKVMQKTLNWYENNAK